ncbi:hypothetical protein T09_5942 [Trichinella sp. T9]|nr:hypothetical protein T09_5942 [Trichinella sp. T9]
MYTTDRELQTSPTGTRLRLSLYFSSFTTTGHFHEIYRAKNKKQTSIAPSQENTGSNLKSDREIQDTFYKIKWINSKLRRHLAIAIAQRKNMSNNTVRND